MNTRLILLTGWTMSWENRLSKLAAKIRKLSDDFAHPRARTTPGSQHARLVAKLTQAVHARDAFIAIAAHELRNPMTPMLAYVEHILSVGRRPENECPEEIIVALERLSNQIAERFARVGDDPACDGDDDPARVTLDRDLMLRAGDFHRLHLRLGVLFRCDHLCISSRVGLRCDVLPSTESTWPGRVNRASC
jgi:signal transduction histidine kinase